MDDALPTKSDKNRRLPSVDEVLRGPDGQHARARYGHDAAVSAVRDVLAEHRQRIKDGSSATATVRDVGVKVLAVLEARDQPTLRRVFNLTGTVLHTNLGRALLAEEAIDAAVTAMRHAVNIEFDIETGARGERDDHASGLIREITGAEACCIVNNNAAAVLLALNTFGQDREAIVSRGELIEIGGAFRLPDIMARAGARLVEVGTTNRTHLRDYEGALTDRTGLVMKAHTSNYLIQGFTASVPGEDLARLAKARNIPFINDLGSGTLIDLGRYGLRREPTVQEALAEGADLVTFSGDKLLGGPQIGVIAGRKDLVAKVAKNPLKRALRIDKVRMAALAATLKLYRDPDRLPERLPALRALVRKEAELTEAARRLSDALRKAFAPKYTVEGVACGSQIGSGALPLESLPSAAIAIQPSSTKTSGRDLEALIAALRRAPIPVIGRISDGRLLLDIRCLDDEAAFFAQMVVTAGQVSGASS